MQDSEQASGNRQTMLRRLQATQFSLQSDRSRLARKATDMQGEIRKMKTDLARLKVSIDEKEAAARSLAREIELIDEELARTKKQMNAL